MVPDLLTETPSDQMLHLHIEGSQHSPGWQQQNNFPSWWAPMVVVVVGLTDVGASESETAAAATFLNK